MAMYGIAWHPGVGYLDWCGEFSEEEVDHMASVYVTGVTDCPEIHHESPEEWEPETDADFMSICVHRDSCARAARRLRGECDAAPALSCGVCEEWEEVSA